jgi:hypothetical protein
VRILRSDVLEQPGLVTDGKLEESVEPKTLSEERTPIIASSDSSGRTASTFLLIVFFATAYALFFHFSQEPPRRTLCFDARQYLFDAERISTFLLQLLKGKLDTAPLTSADFVSSILADGPIFPAFHGTIFALLGHAPQIYDWRLIQVVQSVMHGCSAAMIFLLSYRLTEKRWLAILSGLVWGVYPAAVFWSGIFYTETTVIFFALILACALTASKRLFNDCISGLAAGSLFLLKPALVPAVALALLGRLRDWRHLLIILCFLVIPIIPWALYTKAMTGHASFTAQRFPAFNLAMGADIEVGACMVSPPSALTAMFSRDSDPIAFPLAQWTYHFDDCAKLAAEKISILFAKQSNDLREIYFGFSPLQQNIVHWLIVGLGFAGFLSVVFAGRAGLKTCTDAGKRMIWLCFAVLASHFTYILFTPSARYGFTSTPFLLVMASFFVAKVLAKSASKIELLRDKAVPLALAACLLALMTVISSKSGPGTTDEVTYDLQRGDSAVKMLDLSKSHQPVSDHQAILMVDADGDIDNAVVELNGKRLDEKFKHIRYFNSEIYRQSFELLSLGYPMGLELSDFRNWRAIRIDASALNWKGGNSIKIIAAGPTRLYADKSSTERKMLSPNTYCVNILGNSCDRTDPRIVSPILAAKVEQSSSLNSGNKINKLDSSLRVKLGIGLNSAQPLAPLVDSGKYSASMSHKDFDLYMQDLDGIKMNRQVLKAVQRTGATFPFPEMPNATHLRVLLKGELRSETKNGSAGVVLALLPGATAPSVNLSSVPNAIPASAEWKSFEIEDTVPKSMLAPKAKPSLYVALYPGSWLDVCGYGADRSSPSVHVRNLSFEITGVRQSDLASCRMLYY